MSMWDRIAQLKMEEDQLLARESRLALEASRRGPSYIRALTWAIGTGITAAGRWLQRSAGWDRAETTTCTEC